MTLGAVPGRTLPRSKPERSPRLLNEVSTGIEYRLSPGTCRVGYWPVNYRKVTVGPCDFQEGFTHEVTYPFYQSFTPADFESVEFRLEAAQRLRVKDGFRFSGLIAKDEGCFDDYLATRSLTGVALRKKLVELVEFACAIVVEKPQEVFVLDQTKKRSMLRTQIPLGGLHTSVAQEQLNLLQLASGGAAQLCSRSPAMPRAA